MSKKHRKTAIFTACLLAIMMGVGGTLAFLVDSDDPVTNIFEPSFVTTEISEDTTSVPGVKKDVKIVNTGDTDAYIRAAIVVTWRNDAGEVYGQMPVPVDDYTMTLNEADQTNPAGKWEKIGEYYYWSKPVAPKATTGELITSCTTTKQIDVGNTTYYLAVEIIASGIQAGPDAAVNAWKGVQ